MPLTKGYRHSEATRAKMSAARKGKQFSDEHKSAISRALAGKKRSITYQHTCPCGAEFDSKSPHSKSCSRRCARARRGHGRVHAPEYRGYQRACAICAREDNLVGDHDHDTGKPRGVLCRPCNLAIGNMRDRPDLLRAAADYLERHRLCASTSQAPCLTCQT